MRCHKHSYCGKTSWVCDHDHCYKGCTSSARDCGTHVHFIKCVTTDDCGHKHCYCIPTSIDYPCPCGGHFHYINGTTEPSDCHTHTIIDRTRCC